MKKLEKRQKFEHKIKAVTNNVIRSLGEGTRLSAQQQAANTLVGDTSGVNKAVLATSSYPTMNYDYDTNDMDFGG